MSNIYSTSEFFKNIYSLIMTKLTIRQARFVRRPIYIRGHKSLQGCKRLTTGRFCRFDLDGTRHTLFIGDNCEMGDMTHIVALNKVEIGKNVLIASKCFISDTSHGNYKEADQDDPNMPPNERKLVSSQVIIGDNVWIGENVVILPGSIIGKGCIIGANSVVCSVIPDYSMVVGVPSKIIKRWNVNVLKWEKIIG